MTIATILFLLQTLSFIAVVWLAVKAYRRSAKPAMKQAAMIPFLDDDEVSEGARPRTDNEP